MCLGHLTFIAERDGDGYSISVASFGVVGEFLAILQDRQKWKTPLRNFRVGDTVILKEDTQRNDWRLVKVIKVYKDDKGYARIVQL